MAATLHCQKRQDGPLDKSQAVFDAHLRPKITTVGETLLGCSVLHTFADVFDVLTGAAHGITPGAGEHQQHHRNRSNYYTLDHIVLFLS